MLLRRYDDGAGFVRPNHLDDRADGHLTKLKKRAVMAEVDLSASAVLRQALNEYVERHGYDDIVAWFAEHRR